MTAKKAAKAPTKKAAPKQPEVEPEESAQAVVQDVPEVEGEAYNVGFHGASQDDTDYSMAAEVARLTGSE